MVGTFLQGEKMLVKQLLQLFGNDQPTSLHNDCFANYTPQCQSLLWQLILLRLTLPDSLTSANRQIYTKSNTISIHSIHNHSNQHSTSMNPNRYKQHIACPLRQIQLKGPQGTYGIFPWRVGRGRLPIHRIPPQRAREVSARLVKLAS